MTNGYGQLPHWVTDLLPEIGPYAFAVYGVLLRHADGGTRHSFPSARQIAREAGISLKVVPRCIAILETHGCIRRLRDKGDRYSFQLLTRSSVSPQDTNTLDADAPTSFVSPRETYPHGKRIPTGNALYPHGKRSVSPRETPSIQESLTRITYKNQESAPSPPKTAAKAQRAPAFKPPTADDATAFADEIGMTASEVPRFLDYYTANGWRVGRTPMRDWHAAMRNWNRRAQEQHGSNGNGNGSKPAQARQLTYAEEVAEERARLPKLPDGRIDWDNVRDQTDDMRMRQNYYADMHQRAQERSAAEAAERAARARREST